MAFSLCCVGDLNFNDNRTIENASTFHDSVCGVAALCEQLEQAQRRIEQLERDKQNLNQVVERLKKELEAAGRKTKRAAAPFSRGKPKAKPKTPGRKPGSRDGRHHHHPRPAQVDEQIHVDLPGPCPDCGGPVAQRRVESQF